MLFYFQEWSSYYRPINEQLNGYGTHYFNHEMCSKIKTIRQQIISVEMSKECSRNRWAKSLIKVLVIWNSINTFHFFGQSVTSIETDNQRSCRCEEKVLMWPSWYVLIPHKSHLRVLENMSVRYLDTMLEHKEKKAKLILRSNTWCLGFLRSWARMGTSFICVIYLCVFENKFKEGLII